MKKIGEKIFYVGVNDRECSLFEGLWPLPYGVSYNSYLIVDKKIALIDTVEEPFKEEFIAQIGEVVGERAVDYLVINHMEPDHSSSISSIIERYPNIKIVATARAVPMLDGYYGIGASRIQTVGDGAELSLGETSLRFFAAPMVHWPETMLTWYEAEKTLFSGDAFGTFGFPGLMGGETDGKNSVAEESEEICDGMFENLGIYRDEMIRYYSNIVGKYGVPVQTALKKLAGLEVGRICSTHGPVWERFVGEVVGIYDRLSRYEAEKGVCIAFGTMYGNTEKAARELSAELTALGVPNVVHDLRVENPSAAIRDVFKYDTLILGSPTYNGGIFPPVESFMKAVSARGVKNRKFFAFGSYTWAAASVRLLLEQATALGFELLSLPEQSASGQQSKATPCSCAQEGGLAFPQAFSTQKFDVKTLARVIKDRM